jgi:hypothetical protein
MTTTHVIPIMGVVVFVLITMALTPVNALFWNGAFLLRTISHVTIMMSAAMNFTMIAIKNMQPVTMIQVLTTVPVTMDGLILLMKVPLVRMLMSVLTEFMTATLTLNALILMVAMNVIVMLVGGPIMFYQLQCAQISMNVMQLRVSRGQHKVVTPMPHVRIMTVHITATVMNVGTVPAMNLMLNAKTSTNVLVLLLMRSLLVIHVTLTQPVEILKVPTNAIVTQVGIPVVLHPIWFVETTTNVVEHLLMM